MVRRHTGQAPAGDPGEDLRAGQRPGQRATAAELGGRQVADQCQQQRGVALRLRHQLLAHGRVDGALRRLVDQGRRVPGRERGETPHGQSRHLPVDGPVSGHAEEQPHPAARRVHPCGRVSQRGARRGVPPVHVVHAHQKRGRGRRRAQDAEQHLARRTVPGQAHGAAGGAQQGAQAAVRPFGPGRVGADVPHRPGAEGTGGEREEGRAAATGIAGHDADAAVGAQPVQQFGDLLPLRSRAVPERSGSRGRLSGHPATLLTRKKRRKVCGRTAGMSCSPPHQRFSRSVGGAVCAAAQGGRAAAVPAHNAGGGPHRVRTATGWSSGRVGRSSGSVGRQEVCGQLPRDSSIVRLGHGSGHRNCS